MARRKLSLLQNIEQAIRMVTCALYLAQLSWIALIYPTLQKFFTFIDKKSNNYFSKNYQLKAPIDYLAKGYAYGAMKIMGIDIIVENNGVNQMKLLFHFSWVIHNNLVRYAEKP